MEANIVAKYILQSLASNHIFLPIKQIEYMLYFAQASMLELYNRPLFADPIIRSKYSITIESVYKQYAHYGTNPIIETYSIKERNRLIKKIGNEELDVIDVIIDSLQDASIKLLSTSITNSISTIPIHSIIPLHIIRDTIRKEVLMTDNTINTIEELYNIVIDNGLDDSISIENSILTIINKDMHYKLSKSVVETLAFSLNLATYAIYSAKELLLLAHSYLAIQNRQLLEWLIVKLKEGYKTCVVEESKLICKGKYSYSLSISHSLFTYLSSLLTINQSYPIIDLIDLLMKEKGE